MSTFLERARALRAEQEGKPPVESARPEPSSNGHAPAGDHAKYAAAALERETANVAQAAEGTRNHTLNTAAFSLGQLVAAGRLDRATVADALTRAALAAGLGRVETENTIRSGLTAGQDTPRVIPDLPLREDLRDFAPPPETDAFWEARPALACLRQWARARRVSPWAVLGIALARTVADVFPHIVLPPIVGGHASLNLYVGIVGRSGGGKGAAEAVAAEALGGGRFAQAGVGSGEGIAHMFVKRVKDQVEQHTTAVLFSVPEIDTLTALGDRRGTTLLPELRKAWTGEQLGFAYADKDKRLPVPAHQYRLCLVAGIQPNRANALLGDADGGTPQRFVWLPSTDPDAPDTPPPVPERVAMGGEFRVGTAPDVFSGRVVLGVCQTARDVIDGARLARLRGDGEALDGHALLCQLKVAAALAVLDRHDDVTDEDWRLAGQVMVVSAATRTSVVESLRRAGVEQNERQAEAEATRALIVSERVEDAAVKRVCRQVLMKIKVADDWVSHAELRRSMASRDRRHFEGAVERLIKVGQVVSGDFEYRGQTGIQYRLSGETK